MPFAVDVIQRPWSLDRRNKGLFRRFVFAQKKVVKSPGRQSGDGPGERVIVQKRMIKCTVCPRYCSIKEGAFGFCGARRCRDGKIESATYGLSTGLAVDPIEKKPLNHFYPGSKVLSLGSIGCNLGCRFCQNWGTARSKDLIRLSTRATPDDIVRIAKETGSRSVAFTYNEPIVWAEYAIDIAMACRRAGIKTVAVSNGFISEEWREPFFSFMDAANIDLKAFSDSFYREQCSGSLEPVKETLVYLARKPDTWLEVTTLLIPTLNDSVREIESLSLWVARNLGLETPLHFSAFHPAYQLTSIPSTPPSTLFQAREIAVAAGLQYVYTGNIDDPAGQTTYCPQCRQAVIERQRYNVSEYEIDEESCCRYCGQTIAGQFEDETKTKNEK